MSQNDKEAAAKIVAAGEIAELPLIEGTPVRALRRGTAWRQ